MYIFKNVLYFFTFQIGTEREASFSHNVSYKAFINYALASIFPSDFGNSVKLDD